MDYPSLALSLQDPGNQSATCKIENKEGKNQNKDENRTALQEFGRDQLKLFQAASSTQPGSELHLHARARTKVLPVPNNLLQICGCPVCTETNMFCLYCLQSPAHLLLSQHMNLKQKTSEAVSLPHLLRQDTRDMI